MSFKKKNVIIFETFNIIIMMFLVNYNLLILMIYFFFR